MASSPARAALTLRACAKINVTLRVTGVRADGYHELRTVLQTVELHDTLTCVGASGPFRIECDEPACPADRTNLVWRAAEQVWRAGRRRGGPRGVVVRIAKRIPLQAGLGGGSSDAAAAIRALSQLWRITLPGDEARAIAARLGADVPFFLEGGAALGLERGDLLFPLADCSPQWVTIVIPPFGVSTPDAYGWFDAGAKAPRTASSPAPAATPAGRRGGERAASADWFGMAPRDEYRNDLEGAVAARHPDIARIVRALRAHGAMHAAMSGSGSAVFGIFTSRSAAERARDALAGAGRRSLVTRTVGRARYATFSAAKPSSVQARP